MKAKRSLSTETSAEALGRRRRPRLKMLKTVEPGGRQRA
jgi:hypothetical protein